MYTALIVILIIAATGLVGLILLQQGKGADMGASFGAGASGTV
ncbi:preprotein translocase subunit SecG, partial [Acinetobacter baumannii]|nr:preprotein translocase subunit SecG [Acinetobacter baumannii]